LTVLFALPTRAGDGIPSVRLPFDPGLESVRTLMREKRYNQAIAPLDAYLKRRPDSIWALLFRSKCYVDAGKYKEAIDDLKRAEKVNPTCAAIYKSQTEIYAVEKQYAKAIVSATAAIKYGADRPDRNIFHARSMMYSALGQYKNAIEDMNQYLKIEPGKHRGYMWRGTAYEQDRQYEKAIADYTTAMKKSNSYEYRFHISRVLQKQGKMNEAIAQMSEVIKQNPQEDEGWNKRGNLYFSAGKYKEAVNDFTHALETNFGSEETIYRARARAYEKLGQHDLAQKDLKKADEFRKKPTVSPI